MNLKTLSWRELALYRCDVRDEFLHRRKFYVEEHPELYGTPEHMAFSKEYSGRFEKIDRFLRPKLIGER